MLQPSRARFSRASGTSLEQWRFCPPGVSSRCLLELPVPLLQHEERLLALATVGEDALASSSRTRSTRAFRKSFRASEMGVSLATDHRTMEARFRSRVMFCMAILRAAGRRILALEDAEEPRRSSTQLSFRGASSFEHATRNLLLQPGHQIPRATTERRRARDDSVRGDSQNGASRARQR